jgi:poly(3-hydroxybutyrate) depolymerase
VSYHFHDFWKAGLRNYFNAVSAAANVNAAMLNGVAAFSPLPENYRKLARQMTASAEMMDRFSRHYPKPSFNLPATHIDGQDVAVTVENAGERPYCSLLRFKRDTDRKDPKVLIVAPMSGHYATLLRGTVEALLPDHDVYITDWKDARDVPLRDGPFGLDDYIDYVRGMIRDLGPDVHVLAVCQPTVPVMAAVATMAAEKDAVQPLSMTLMGGPIDTRAAPTAVSKYAERHPIEWFRDNVTMTVPPWYKGAGQRVYPGFLQLTGFMMMNPDKHYQSHQDLFKHLCEGNDDAAQKIRDFYDEYLAVCDLHADFYLQTVEHVFQKQSLARGTLTWRGQPVDPSKITKTSVFTVEGALDDIAAPGQTESAHRLLTGLAPQKHYHHLQDGAGHYGIFNGRKWREEICPQLAGFIRKTGAENGQKYDPPGAESLRKNAIKIPSFWVEKSTDKPLKNMVEYHNDNNPKKTGDRGTRLG